MELLAAAHNKEELTWDTECYPNYWLSAFKSVQTGKVIIIETILGGSELDIRKLYWVLHNFKIINFNGRKYDFPITALALAQKTTQDMWLATKMLIAEKDEKGKNIYQPKDIYKKFKVARIELHANKDLKPWVNQIDLIELTALGPGLKVCAGRLHAPRMQDLPFEPGTWLTENQIAIVRRYCVNDLDNTELLFHAVTPQIAIRESQGGRYGLDLRSHSDAQMAEAIISAEVKRITGKKHLQRTTLPPGTWYNFKTPHFIKYESAMMKAVLGIIQKATFWVDHNNGNIISPPEFEDLVVHMANCKYQMGIGGLHSQEESVAHIADENYAIIDTDADSYYPKLILNAGLTPENLGKDFLIVFNNIVVERLSAKALIKKLTGKEMEEQVAIAECLKIVVNGTFGKLGSMWSIVYAPNLLIQVTLTGQLSILMLAERFELNNIEVISVNTDGIIVKCLRSKEKLFKEIVTQWGKDTGFTTEETRYKATYSKDVNNYIAVYEKPQKGKLLKTKGAYGDTAPKKNAVTEICIDAIKTLLTTQTPIAETILSCKDIRKFTSMRAVKGGAVKVTSSQFDPTATAEEMQKVVIDKGFYFKDGMWIDTNHDDPFADLEKEAVYTLQKAYQKSCQVTDGIYLGKIIRWYYSNNVKGEIIYALTGNKVALTQGAMPCMDLPDKFPDDIDFDLYINNSYKILEEIGYSPKTVKVKK